MEISFLHTEGESLALFLSVPYYVGVMFHIQGKYLKLLARKNIGSIKKKEELKKLYSRALLLLLVGPVLHFIFYWSLYDVFTLENGKAPDWRNQYLLWILATFLGFVLGTLLNFYLKGTSTLPTQEGQVTGVS